MYKTIKHGDNSLQYTILPQEEGTVNVKPKKSRKKGKTAAILTITVILICGIIATAVLVPMLLTSDLVVLPAAFQKFSVSSLRKSHSGNHVVVLAKKPHGWTNHHSPSHPAGNNKTNSSNNNNNAYKPQEEILRIPVNSTTTIATMQTTKIVQQTTEKPTTMMSNEIESNKIEDNKGIVEKNVLRAYERNKYTEVPIGRNYLDISTTTRSSKGNEFLGDKVVRLSNTEMLTTSSPWHQKKWSFGHSYMRWTGNVTDNFTTVLGGTGIVLLCLVIIFVVWIQRRNVRSNAIKKSTDAKADDKDTLLKESAAGSEEE